MNARREIQIVKVKLTVYKDFLVIDTLKREADCCLYQKDADFRPIESGFVGCSLKNTGKHLGISKEALAFMKELRVSGDDLAELNTYITTDGTHCFGWLGAPCRLVGVEATLPHIGFTDIDFVEIPNITNDKAMASINKECNHDKTTSV